MGHMPGSLFLRGEGGYQIRERVSTSRRWAKSAKPPKTFTLSFACEHYADHGNCSISDYNCLFIRPRSQDACLDIQPQSGERSSTRNCRRIRIECNLADIHYWIASNLNFIPFPLIYGTDQLIGTCRSIDLSLWGSKYWSGYSDMAGKPSNVTVTIMFIGDGE